MPRQYATLDADGFVPLAQLRYSYRSLMLDLGPVAYWRLGEASGTTAADTSGNGLDGSYVNAPTLGVPGALAGDTDTAVLLNGTTQYISVADVPALRLAQDLTLVAWIKITPNAEADARIISHRSGSVGYELIVVTSSGLLNGFIGGSLAFSTPVEASGASLQDDAWHFVGMTWDGTTIRLYRDGAQSHEQAASAATLGSLEVATTTMIGRYNPSAIRFLEGAPDEAAIWNRALTAAEISRLHEAGI